MLPLICIGITLVRGVAATDSGVDIITARTPAPHQTL